MTKRTLWYAFLVLLCCGALVFVVNATGNQTPKVKQDVSGTGAPAKTTPVSVDAKSVVRPWNVPATGLTVTTEETVNKPDMQPEETPTVIELEAAARLAELRAMEAAKLAEQNSNLAPSAPMKDDERAALYGSNESVDVEVAAPVSIPEEDLQAEIARITAQIEADKAAGYEPSASLYSRLRDLELLLNGDRHESGSLDDGGPAPSTATVVTLTGGYYCDAGVMGGAVDTCAGRPFSGVWYTFTVPTAGKYRISTAGSLGDTEIRILVNTLNCTALTTYNDNAGGLDAALDTTLAAGDVVLIEIGYYSATAADAYWFQVIGPVDATVPANDACASAVGLTIGTPVNGKTRGATTDGTLPSCGGASTYYAGVWYTVLGNGRNLTASCNNICSSGDTRITVFTGTCGAFTCVGGNDNANTNVGNAEYTWCSVDATTYYIFVSNASSTAARQNFEFTLNVTEGIICACDQMAYCGTPTETENNNQCAVFDVTTLGCDQTIYALHCPEADSDWFKVTIPAQTILTLAVYDGLDCSVLPPTTVRFSYKADSCTAATKGPYTTAQSLLNCTANPQDIYVLVYAAASTARGPYKLVTTCTTTLYCGTPIETEPNNQCAAFDAQVLNCANPTVYGLHCPAADSDFFKVEVPAGTYAILRAYDGAGCTVTPPTTIYTQLYTGACVASGSAGTANKIVDRGCATTDTTVYIMVKTYSTTAYTSAYKIALQCSTLTHPANDLCANAEVVAIGSSTLGNSGGACGDVAPACDGYTPPTSGLVTWYQFVGNGNLVQVGTCNAATTTDPRVVVYSGTCGALVCETADDDDCTTPALGSLDTLCTQPGVTYIVCVYMFSAGPYQLDLVDLGVSCMIGRCCYGDYGAPSCTDTTEARCAELSGVWEFGVNCTANPCQPTPLGEFCDYPIPITAFPYQMIDSTCRFADDYYDVTCMGTTYYDEGPDVLYSITLAEDTCITVTLTSTSNTGGTYPYGSVTLFEGCPDLNQCVATAYSSTSPVTITCTRLTAGIEYFLMVDNWPSPPCIYYTLDVDMCPCPQPCPPVVCESATMEIEPNGGCKTTTTEPWNPIACGGSVQGYVIYDATLRDYDGYEFTVAGPGRENVVLTLDPEFDGIIELRNYTGACPDASTTNIIANSADRCGQEVLTAVLRPGTYHAYVYPVLEPSVLDSEHYCMSMTCSPWVCPTDYTLTAPGFISGDMTGDTLVSDCDLRAYGEEITAVTIPYESDWLFSMCGPTTQWDSYMYITYACCDTPVLAYDDDACGGSFSAMDTCIHLLPGVIYVDIEAYGDATVPGPYELHVTDCICPPVTCTSTVEEVEPNNGCNDSTFQAIVCTDVVHGTVTATTSNRDVDAYELTLIGDAIVTMVVVPEFDALLGIYRMDGVNVCPDIYVTGVDGGVNCVTETLVSQCLPAGVYHIYVSPTFTNIITPADYCLTVTCEACVAPYGRCCYGEDPFAPLCENNYLFECEDLVGTWTEGITCESDPCPLPPDCPEGSMISQRPYLASEGWGAATTESSLGYNVYDDFFSVDGPIGSVTFWGLHLYHDGTTWVACNEDPMPFDIKFYGYGAEPAAEVCTYSVTLTGTAVTTGLPFNGLSDLWEYTAVLDPPCSINPGWISIQAGGATDCYFLWIGSPEGNAIGLQWDGTVYTSLGYDLGVCFGIGPCDKVENLTIYPVLNDNAHVWLRFTAPAAGNYKIYTTIDKNNDGEPDGGADADFGPAIATVTAAAANEVVVWTDTSTYVGYRNYVVSHDCSVQDAEGRCCYGNFMNPTCVDSVTMGECDALSGTWTYGLNCVDNPCEPGQYCASTSSDCPDPDDWITNVTFNTINNTTADECATANYGDYTAISTTVVRGSSYTLSVSFSSGIYSECVRVWFDWNLDGVFDQTTESVALGCGVSTTLSTSITVPLTATVASTRMRVIENYYSDPTSACGVNSYSNTEDYTIIVQ